MMKDDFTNGCNVKADVPDDQKGRHYDVFEEVAAFAQVLSHTGILQTIQKQVRFARARFGQYDLIDFVVVLLGYAISGEPTLQAFYERLNPFAEAFMALFDRKQLPHRSTLSRFLAALDETTVEALRTLFQKDLLARSPLPSPGELGDRTGTSWLVMDVDGTRATARQRALPHGATLPAPHRRFDAVCAPGYTGRKRGEVVNRLCPPDSLAHGRGASPYPPVPGHLWWIGQWRLPRGAFAGRAGHQRLCDQPGLSLASDIASSRWPLWRWRGAPRCGGS